MTLKETHSLANKICKELFQKEGMDFQETTFEEAMDFDPLGFHTTKYKFRFNDSVAYYGWCSYTKREIIMSRKLIPALSDEDVEDVIRHEIAHAISVHRHGRSGKGHGTKWKEVCVEVGARPVRCGKPFSSLNQDIIRTLRKWIGVCPECMRERERATRQDVACHVCCNKHNNGRYSKKYKMVYFENPNYKK